MDNFTYLLQQPRILVLFLAWVLFWKGLALWKAAHRDQVYWFIAILLVNLGGLFSILYIYVFSEWKTIRAFLEKRKRREDSFSEDSEETKKNSDEE